MLDRLRNSWLRPLRRWLRDDRGTLALELAFAMPVVLVLLYSGIEVTRYVMLNQKVERTAATLADLVSQAEDLTEGGLATLFEAANFVMDPYSISGDGLVVVSSIVNHGNGAVISWQRNHGGGSGGSAFGAQGGSASLPPGFVVRENETAVVAEVYFDYEPILLRSVVETQTLYTFALFRPRFSSLETLLP
ncbi:MAG: pilus assembly protein [Rhodobacterales bacterium]|nr:pilus assembly protein [Rhodobacterales bacterium]